MNKTNKMNKLERKWGKYAISNISLYLIICYGIGFSLEILAGEMVMNLLTLDPHLILRGQIWRIFTWILIPPPSSNLFFTLIMLYFYYSIGSTLENVWGTFRYNVYLISGFSFTVIGSFLLYFMFALSGDMTVVSPEAVTGFYASVARMFSTYYINMSIFLAYAATFPHMEVMLMMILPIKVKWLGIIYGVMLLGDFLMGGTVSKFVIGASLLNFVVFFLTSGNFKSISPKQVKKRQTKKMSRDESPMGRKHRCAICGKTSEDGEELEFRFCSKCEGNYEYCQDHLFTHEHVTKK